MPQNSSKYRQTAAGLMLLIQVNVDNRQKQNVTIQMVNCARTARHKHWIVVLRTRNKWCGIPFFKIILWIKKELIPQWTIFLWLASLQCFDTVVGKRGHPANYPKSFFLGTRPILEKNSEKDGITISVFPSCFPFSFQCWSELVVFNVHFQHKYMGQKVRGGELSLPSIGKPAIY